jgi:cell division protein FtsI (penicillin-binding protein 3)
MTRKEDNGTHFKDRKRLLCISLAIFACFALLVAQFYKIQILEGDKWTKMGDRQHYFIVKEPFMRGTFISNTAIKKGHPEVPQSFVIDVKKFHLFSDSSSIPPQHRDAIAHALADILGIDPAQEQKLKSHLSRKSRSRKLAMWLDKHVHDAI